MSASSQQAHQAVCPQSRGQSLCRAAAPGHGHATRTHALRPAPAGQPSGIAFLSAHVGTQLPRPDVTCGALSLAEAPTRPAASDFGPQLGWPARLEDDFTIGKLLGSGTFGVVHAATHKRSASDTYAVKVLRKGGPRSRVADTLARVSREVEVLEALQGCAQVARLVAKYESARFVYLVLERCHGPSMMQVMKDPAGLTEAQVCCLMFECLQVLNACHDKRILYGDVKAANFMMTRPLADVPVCDVIDWQEPVLKAVDFGCSRYLAPGQHMRELVGSPAYTAPEVHLHHYELPSDIWSLGMTFYQLVTGKLPFWDSYRQLERSSWEQLTRCLLMEEISWDHPRWQAMGAECRDLCARMLDRDPTTRLTAREAMQHDWFSAWACRPVSTNTVWANNVLPLHPK